MLDVDQMQNYRCEVWGSVALSYDPTCTTFQKHLGLCTLIIYSLAHAQMHIMHKLTTALAHNNVGHNVNALAICPVKSFLIGLILVQTHISKTDAP